MTEFLKTDCRHVRWDRPCAPHKERGRECATCPEHDPVRRRVLLVKLAAVGDVLRTTALLPAIRAAWPQAWLAWLTRPDAVDLFGGNPLVDEVLRTDDAVTAARLATERWDVVLCPDADPDAASLAAMARADDRRGFTRGLDGAVQPLSAAAAHWFQMGLSDARKRDNTRTYQSLVAESLGLDPAAVGRPILEPGPADRARAEAILRATGFRGAWIGLNTGAGGRWLHKQWTLEHQQAFLRLMARDGRAVLLLGGPQEVERHRALLASATGLPVFDGGNRHSYRTFAALVERCAALVTGDTLALHVATARSVPAVVLFGPTSAAEIELYGPGAKIQPEGFGCLCCYLPTCDVKPHCMAAIEPRTVASAVAGLLGG